MSLTKQRVSWACRGRAGEEELAGRCNADERKLLKSSRSDFTFHHHIEMRETFEKVKIWFAHLGRVVGPLIQDELFLHIWKEGLLLLSAVQKSSMSDLVSWSLWHQHEQFIPTNSTHTTLKILHRKTNVLLLRPSVTMVPFPPKTAMVKQLWWM